MEEQANGEILEKTKEEKLNEFQCGIALIKDKILHLKKLTLMTDDDTHKQHLCDYHLQTKFSENLIKIPYLYFFFFFFKKPFENS